MRVLIDPMAFYKILNHSNKDLGKEVAGYLIGKFTQSSLHITDATITEGKGTSTHILLNEHGMIRVAEKLENRGTSEHIIGWYHSHPRLGANFFSHIDINTQSKYQIFFPQAIGLVIDPYKFSISSNFEDVDCYIYHIQKEKPLMKIKFSINLELKRGLERIYLHLKRLSQNIQSFFKQFENFIEKELDGKVYPNYYGNNYRINYQMTPKRIWAHIYTKSNSRFQENDLVIKGYFRGKSKKIEKEFEEIGFKVRIIKDHNTNYYFLVFNLTKVNFSKKLSELLKELYENWESNMKKSKF